jgi:hypothetical protein
MDAHAQSMSPGTFLDEWIGRGHWTWPRTTAAIAAVMLLLLAAVSYLDGVFSRPFDSRLWRINMLGPVVIVYILAAWPIFQRLRRGAIETFRDLVEMPGEEFDRFVVAEGRVSRPIEWLVFGACAILGVMILRPWDMPQAFFWTRIYRVVASATMCGLAGSVVYASLAGARILHKLHLRPLRIDIFDPSPLEPIAWRSLFRSLVFLGAITLGILLVPDQDARGIVLNGAIILVAVLLFFAGLQDTHNVMAAAKARELRVVRQRLNESYRRFTELMERDPAAEPKELSTISNLLINYEKRVEAAPEWPFTSSILRRLLVSTLVPVIVLSTQKVLIDGLIWLVMSR